MTLTMSAKQRKAVYQSGAAVGAALVAFGAVEAEVVPVLLGVLYAFSNLLATFNVTPDDDPTDEELDATAIDLPEDGVSDVVED